MEHEFVGWEVLRRVSSRRDMARFSCVSKAWNCTVKDIAASRPQTGGKHYAAGIALDSHYQLYLRDAATGEETVVEINGAPQPEYDGHTAGAGGERRARPEDATVLCSYASILVLRLGEQDGWNLVAGDPLSNTWYRLPEAPIELVSYAQFDPEKRTLLAGSVTRGWRQPCSTSVYHFDQRQWTRERDGDPTHPQWLTVHRAFAAWNGSIYGGLVRQHDVGFWERTGDNQPESALGKHDGSHWVEVCRLDGRGLGLDEIDCPLHPVVLSNKKLLLYIECMYLYSAGNLEGAELPPTRSDQQMLEVSDDDDKTPRRVAWFDAEVNRVFDERPEWREQLGDEDWLCFFCSGDEDDGLVLHWASTRGFLLTYSRADRRWQEFRFHRRLSEVCHYSRALPPPQWLLQSLQLGEKFAG